MSYPAGTKVNGHLESVDLELWQATYIRDGLRIRFTLKK
jgi:hypothetical protein